MSREDLSQSVSHTWPAGDQNSCGNHSHQVKSCKSRKVTIEEWVFVVPLDLESEPRPIGELPEMVNFMRRGINHFTVDCLAHPERLLSPTDLFQSRFESLSDVRFPA